MYPSKEFLARDAGGVGTGSDRLDVSVSDAIWAGAVPVSLRVHTDGDVKFTGLDGSVDTWPCVAGDLIPIAVTKVWAVGTTATLSALFRRVA